MLKRRELLPVLNNAIAALTAMAGEAATLEISDNEQASRRLKRMFKNFTSAELITLENSIISVREELRTRKKKVIGNQGKNLERYKSKIAQVPISNDPIEINF